MYYGIYRAVVSGGADPESSGRIQVSVPDLPSGSVWARTCSPPGVRGRYSTGQMVWVMFEKGDLNYPVVIGVSS